MSPPRRARGGECDVIPIDGLGEAAGPAGLCDCECEWARARGCVIDPRVRETPAERRDVHIQVCTRLLSHDPRVV